MAIVRRNDPVRLLGRRLLIALLFVLVIAATIGVWNSYQKERESAQLRAQAESELADLTKREAGLDANIATLQTARGKEAVLRDQFALAGEGEQVIVIVDSTTTKEQATSSAFAEWLHKTFPWW